MNRKLLATLLAILILLLAACGGSKETPEPTEPAAAEEQVAEEPATEEATDVPTDVPIEEEVVVVEEAQPTTEPVEEVVSEEATSADESVETPVISVGINAEFEPFVFVNENGNLSGFDIDLMNALSAAAGFEMAYVTTSFETIFDGLENGDFDAAISAITITDGRKERVDFTNPYFEPGMAPVSYFSSGQGVAVLTDNMTIMGADDLTADVTVGVKKGTTGAEFVANETEAKVSAYDEAIPVLQALVSAEVTAVVLDMPVIIEFIKANPGAAIKLVGGPVTDEQYGIAVSKDRPRVLEGLNLALQQIQESGAYDQIFQKWFGTP
jgi:ABC-type amino acid transport substrate-binding protein